MLAVWTLTIFLAAPGAPAMQLEAPQQFPTRDACKEGFNIVIDELEKAGIIFPGLVLAFKCTERTDI